MSTTTKAERPIIFNAWSINRTLTDAKTQTRRTTGLDEINENPDLWQAATYDQHRQSWYFLHEPTGANQAVKCPYGQPGDVLWVREAFRLPHRYNYERPKAYVEQVPYPQCRYEADGFWLNSMSALSIEPQWGKCRPSIHMPKELCRLRLRNEGVRVQRIQEISGADCIAEGIPSDTSEWATVLPFDDVVLHHANGEQSAREGYPIEKDAFATLWNTIHEQGAWTRNEWVWVVEYELIHP